MFQLLVQILVVDENHLRDKIFIHHSADKISIYRLQTWKLENSQCVVVLYTEKIHAIQLRKCERSHCTVLEV